MEDILDSFRLSDDERKLYATARGKFESYLMNKRNILSDQISFYQRRQEKGGSVASFINDAYALVKHCNFSALHDEIIRDILVASIRDTRSSECLQLDSDLTL